MSRTDQIGLRAWEAAVVQAPVGIGLCDEDGKFLAISNALALLLRRPAHQILGRPFLSFIHPDERPASLAAYFEAVVACAAGVRSGSREVRCLTGDDGVVAVQVNWTVTEPDQFGNQHAIIYVRPLPAPPHRPTQVSGVDAVDLAADLHDHVIQELFATGMGLQSIAASLPGEQQRRQILNYVQSLDRTVRRLRALINEGGPDPVREDPVPLTERLAAIARSFTPALASPASIAFVGPLDSTITAPLARDLEAVVREALANVARHARATTVGVVVTVTGDRLILDVIDNGTGLVRPTRSSGVANMHRRARTHRGALSYSTPTGGGTHLRWTARTSPSTRA